jgi:hypothetical protein
MLVVNYTAFKFAHILIAIVALGTGAALGIVLTFFARDRTHHSFVLRTVRRLLYSVVMPGYGLMLATGMWTAHLGGLLDADWAEAAMNLWGVGAILIALAAVGLHRQIKSFDSTAPSRAYRATLGRLSAGGATIVILAMLYLMVFKP